MPVSSGPAIREGKISHTPPLPFSNTPLNDTSAQPKKLAVSDFTGNLHAATKLTALEGGACPFTFYTLAPSAKFNAIWNQHTDGQWWTGYEKAGSSPSLEDCPFQATRYWSKTLT